MALISQEYLKEEYIIQIMYEGSWVDYSISFSTEKEAIKQAWILFDFNGLDNRVIKRSYIQLDQKAWGDKS